MNRARPGNRGILSQARRDLEQCDCTHHGRFDRNRKTTVAGAQSSQRSPQSNVRWVAAIMLRVGPMRTAGLVANVVSWREAHSLN
jgi:hypothetical protein